LRAPFPFGTAAPRAQELKLTVEPGRAGLIAQALAQPSMPRLRLLSLFLEDHGGPGSEPFAPLWAAPWLSQLQELTLVTDQGFGSAGLAPLRAAPLLRKLAIELCEGAPVLTAADGRALAAAPLPALRELRLHGVAGGLVAALAAAPWLGGLETLRVTASDDWPPRRLTAEDGRALAAAPLMSIKWLLIANAESGFMAACVAAPWLSRVERLDLTRVPDLLAGGLGPRPHGPPAMAMVPLAALVRVSFECDSVPAPDQIHRFAALISAPWFGRLQWLHLGDCFLGTAGGLDGAGLRALAAASLPSLSSLILTNAHLSATDVSGVLSSAPWLATLTRLMLSSNPLGEPGHRALSQLHLPRLRDLCLYCSGLNAVSLAVLASATWLTQLAELALGEDELESAQSYASMMRLIEDDAWVFGRLRRLGCNVDTGMLQYYGRLAFGNASSDDEPASGDDAGSGDELASGDEAGSDDEEGSGDEEGSELDSDPSDG
jgi:hypothetical protein